MDSGLCLTLSILKDMNNIPFSILLVFGILSSCAHNETPVGDRGIASLQEIGTGRPQWENDLCVLKGESREQDYIVRFSDVHSLCPPLRDYNAVGQAYTKLKNAQKGVHLPSCQPQPVQSRNVASRCWMGLDVFGNTMGSCKLGKSQSSCTSCQCDVRQGIAWQ